MFSRLLCCALLLAIATTSFAQEVSPPLRHRPWGMTLEMPGVYFMNLHAMNSSQTLIANAHSIEYLVGLHVYVGRRDRFFVSAGINGRHYTQELGYYDANSGDPSTTMRVHKLDLMFYKPVYARKKTMLFAMAGVMQSKMNFDGWERTSPGMPTFRHADYTAKQWGLDLGVMYDFARTDIGRHDISIGLKMGYTIPLAKARWYTPTGRVAPVEQITMGGLHFTLMINYF